MNRKMYRRFGSNLKRWTARPVLGAALVMLMLLAACGKDEPVATTAAPAAAGVAAGASAEVVPGAASAIVPASVPQLLTSASKAFSEDRLVAPVGDNAIEYYLAVLGTEKDNIQATQGLVDLFPMGVSIAEKEIAGRNVAEAERIIGLLDESSPGSYTVQKLKSRLTALQNQIARDEEKRLAAEQAQQQVAQQRVAQEQAAAAAAVEPPPTARPTTTATPPRDARPAATASTTEPAPTPAAPSRPVGETKDAKVVRQVQPGYPQLAYRRRLAGWVEIRFTVGTDGRVSDAQVIRSDPPRMFDREATRAVEQWQFEPALRDGVPVPATLSRRIEFKYPG
jgi:periplasmic protein TonB